MGKLDDFDVETIDWDQPVLTIGGHSIPTEFIRELVEAYRPKNLLMQGWSKLPNDGLRRAIQEITGDIMFGDHSEQSKVMRTLTVGNITEKVLRALTNDQRIEEDTRTSLAQYLTDIEAEDDRYEGCPPWDEIAWAARLEDAIDSLVKLEMGKNQKPREDS